MATQTYMTAKLNLADGTIVYPQISLDNIVKSISDPTLVTVAQLDANSKVSISNLPVTTSVTSSNSTVPTNGAVYGALNTKQATLVEGDNIIHIINGSTIMADITNLDVAGIDQTATNGVHLVLDGGNTISAAADLAANNSAGVIAGASDGVKLVDGVAQFDNATVDAATPAEITGGTANKVVQVDDFERAMYLSRNDTIPLKDILERYNWVPTFVGYGAELTFDEDGTPTFSGTNRGDNFFSLTFYEVPGLTDVRGQYLVLCEFFLPADSAATGFDIRRSTNGAAASISGSDYVRSSTTKGSWVKLGCFLDTTSGSSWGFRINVDIAANSPLTFKMRNLRIISTAGMASSEYTLYTNNPIGYIYENGSGIAINGSKIGVDEATPKDVMNGVNTKTVTPNSLKSSFSVGQAVDCTAEPYIPGTLDVFEPGTVEVHGSTITADAFSSAYRDDFRLISKQAQSAQIRFGFDSNNYYPKAAALADGTPLRYLMMADITNNSEETLQLGAYSSFDGTAEVARPLKDASGVAPHSTVRLYYVFEANMVNNQSQTYAYILLRHGTNTVFDVTVSKLRQFEVMALTDDAIKYLAGVEDPDNADAQYFIKTDMVSPWTNIIDMQQATAVTVASGLAYKSTVLSGGTCTFSTDTVPAGTYGRDAHLTLFLDVSASVTFQSPLVLMDPLTPGAGHNMTIKYRDGQALAYVDDTDIGYIVTVTSGTGDGSLYLGLTTGEQYITFSHLLDGSTITMPATITPTITSNNRVNIIGNGIGQTKIDSVILADQPAGASAITLYGVESTKPIATNKSYRITNCYIHDTGLSYTPASNAMYAAGQVSCQYASSITGSTFTRLGDVLYDIVQNYNYAVDDCCIYNTATYYWCIKACTGEEAGSFDNTEYFKPAASYDSSWGPNKHYVVDAVARNSSNYALCIKEIPANSNIAFDNAEYWKPAHSYVYAHAYGDVYVGNSAITWVDDCIFDSCVTTALGGAPGIISNCQFINNGRGFYQGNADSALSNCLFSGNTSEACTCAPSTRATTITGCTFATASDKITIASGTASFAGVNIINSTVSVAATSTVKFLAGSTVTSTDGGGYLDFSKAPQGSALPQNTRFSNVTIKGNTNKLFTDTYGDVFFDNVAFSDFFGPGGLIAGWGNCHIYMNGCSFSNVTDGFIYAANGNTHVDITDTTATAPITMRCYAGHINIKNCSCDTTNKLSVFFNNSIPLASPSLTITDSVFYSIVSGHGTGLVEFYGTNVFLNKVARVGRVHLMEGSSLSFVGNTLDTVTVETDSVAAVGSYMDEPSGQFIVGGTATIINGSGVSSTVEGLGNKTWKNGTTDFEVPYKVTSASGTNAGSLYDALTAATPKKHILMDYANTEATATLDADVTSRDTAFVAADGLAIIKGTFTLPSSTVVGVTIAKDDAGVTNIRASTVSLSGGTIGGGVVPLIGVLSIGSDITVTGGTIKGDTYGGWKGVIQSSSATMLSVNSAAECSGVTLNGVKLWNVKKIENCAFSNKAYTIPSDFSLIQYSEAGETCYLTGATVTAAGGEHWISYVVRNFHTDIVLSNCKFYNVGTWSIQSGYAGKTMLLDSYMHNQMNISQGHTMIIKGSTVQGNLVRGSNKTEYIFDGLNICNGACTKNNTGTTDNGWVRLISGSTVNLATNTSESDTIFANDGTGKVVVGTFADATNYSGTWTTATSEAGAATIITSGGTYHVYGEGTFINKTLNPNGATPEERGTDLTVIRVS